MRIIKKLVVHCSDSDDSLDFGVKDIRKWHTDLPPKGRGWSDVGYHYVIRRDGRIERGRQDETVGAHVYGHNSNSIGICLVGRTIFAKEQWDSMYMLLRGLMNKYSLEVVDIYGHYELDSNKTCPNLQMDFIRCQALFIKGAIDVDQI